MKENQSLFDITTYGLKHIENIFNQVQPDLVITQGDTSTAFLGGLAAFYNQVPVAHIEAGLRTGNNKHPFPEEMNRKLLSQLTTYHFSPTKLAHNNLIKEGITENIETVGNTVIDALLMGLDLIEPFAEDYQSSLVQNGVDFSKRIILVTSHRRESFGDPLKRILQSVQELASSFNDIQIVFPIHPNPNVQQTLNPLINDKHPNILPITPLNYPNFIWLMKNSHLIMTDSGGIQEEAPSLNKPVLVLRNETERIEGIEAGTAKLVGQDKPLILESVHHLLTNTEAYNQMSQADNPYGDGKASERIVTTLNQNLNDR